MKYFLELSKECSSLPTNEIIACLQAERIPFEIIYSTRDCFVFETNQSIRDIRKMADRLAFSFTLNKFIFDSNSDIRNLIQEAEKHTLEEDGSIAVRYRNRSDQIDSQKIVEELATIYTKERDVSLQNPDILIRAILTNDRIYVGQLLSRLDREQYEKRKAQHRPFFSPISMHPKIARALVNLSKVGRNQILFDPFCGTGGILIEAGLIGADVIGSDVSEKMVEGTKENLAFYDIDAKDLFTADIGDCTEFIDGVVDTVVTDLPYGKATTTKGESLEALYKRAFESIHSVLKPGGRAVLGLPSKDEVKTAEELFILQQIFEIPAHRSLTRYFTVLEKQP